MILLDQDLEPDPVRRRRKTAVPSTNWSSAPVGLSERLPAPATLKRFLVDAKFALKLCGQVSVLLTTDRAIRKMNREFRGIDKATDVLSFPAGPVPGQTSAEAPAGDLAISVETAGRQAAEQSHALSCELKILILHGLLHLAGYDHETDDGRMARRERALRAELGLPQGLIERSAQSERGLVAHVVRRKDGKAKAPRSRMP